MADNLLALVGGTVIDGNGGPPIKDGVVLMDGRRILAVGDRSVAVPADARRVPVAGKYVIPGLLEPFTVLSAFTWPPANVRFEGRYDELVIESAQIALKNGITTVFDNLGPRDPLIRARDAINEGRASGARVYLCGNHIGLGGPYSPDLREHADEEVGEDSVKHRFGSVLTAIDPEFKARFNALFELNVGEPVTRMGLDEAREEIREYLRSGIDYAIFLVNSHRYGCYQYLALSPRVQRMIVEEAARLGLRTVAAFASTEEGINIALDSGADSWFHSGWGRRRLSGSTIERIAASGSYVHLAAMSERDMEWHRRQPDSMLWPGCLDMLETKLADNRAIIESGALIVSGGNSVGMYAEERQFIGETVPPDSWPEIGAGQAINLRSLQEQGMTPMNALLSTTRNVARAYGVDADLGTLAPGKLADVVVLDRNPLEDTENYRRIHLVFKEGEAVDGDGLPTQRLWSAGLADATKERQ